MQFVYTRSSATADGPRDVEILSTAAFMNELYNKSTTKPSNVVRVIEIEHYRWWTCNKLRASSRDASTVVLVLNNLDRRRVLLTTWIYT